jgi:hypothetical protein
MGALAGALRQVAGRGPGVFRVIQMEKEVLGGGKITRDMKSDVQTQYTMYSVQGRRVSV